MAPASPDHLSFFFKCSLRIFLLYPHSYFSILSRIYYGDPFRDLAISRSRYIAISRPIAIVIYVSLIGIFLAVAITMHVIGYQMSRFITIDY